LARRRPRDVLRQLAQVLGGGGEQDFVAGAAQAAQPEAVELEDALHVGEGHLDLLAFMPGALESGCVGKGAGLLSYRLIDVAGHPAVWRIRTAALLHGAVSAIGLAGAIEPGSAIMDPARGFEFLITGANIEVTQPVIGKVGAGEGAVAALAFVPERDMRLNTVVNEALQGGGAAIGGVGGKPPAAEFPPGFG